MIDSWVFAPLSPNLQFVKKEERKEQKNVKKNVKENK